MDDVTQFVFRLIMVVYIAVGLGILFSPEYYRKAFQRMFENRGITYFGGIIALVVGFGVITHHNVWEGWPLLVTLFGWLAFLKGTAVLVVPEHFMKVSTRLVKNDHFYGYGVMAIVFGFVFGYFGYFGYFI